MMRIKSWWKTEVVGQAETCGIVGEGEYVENLKKKLEKQGSEVFVSPSLLSISPKLTYLFVFSDFENASSLFTKKSFKETKVLIVLERHPKKILDRLEKLVTKSENIKLLKIGEMSSWNVDSLAESCLWAMFNSDLGKVVDISKEPIIQPAAKKIKYPMRLSLNLGRLTKIGLLFFIFISPVLIIVALFVLSMMQMRAAFFFLSRGDFEGLEKNFSAYENLVKLEKKMMIPIPLYQDYVNFFEGGRLVVNDVMGVRKDLLIWRDVLESGDLLEIKNRFKKVNDGTIVLKKNLNKFRKEFESIPVPFLDKNVYEKKIDDILEAVDFGQKAMPMIEKALFGKEKLTYLVLFQNNTELRPTGGFIGSYALVRGNQGKILNYTFYDVYEADGQLKAHVDPPTPIRNYLQQPNWFLRDSNFDPDFSISAQQAMWFLERETGEKVDGVAAINLNLVTRLLDDLDGVYVPDYREEVNADNFLLKATTYAQEGFFPGSTAKRDYLRSVGNAIVYEVLESKQVDYMSIILSLRESLERKDILLNSSDNNLQKMIEGAGWGGRVVDVSCVRDNCFADYFLAIDANLGVNKANLYVSKRTTIEKLFDESGKMVTRVNLAYVNESPADVFPAGAYKNYIRIFMPAMVTVTDVTIDGQSIIGEVSLASYGSDKRELGFFVEVPSQSSREIVINYESIYPKTLSAYQFFLAKQPGEREGSVDLTFKFPVTINVSPSNFKPNNDGGIYSLITDSAVDRIFVFDIKSR
ncbi:DUF4012 domain-containing protein [Candidatus Gottesmanbacteria bacterium]|nr:DUF4012 domain-containing protein [Candidatus Gottesmanbacteria bacterium]